MVIALVVTPDGFPLAYEVMNWNTSDRTTLRGFLNRIEERYGQARRVWVMDGGIPSEAILKEMRRPERQTFYLVGTPKGRINQHEKMWLDLPWQKVRDSVEVKLYQHEGELYVLAKSQGRQAKEVAMRRKRLARLLRKLRVMRKSRPKRDQLLLRIGAARKEAGRAFGFVKIQIPTARQAVTPETFWFRVDKPKLKAAEKRDGHYLLRSNLTAEDPEVLWARYVQLTQIESVFRLWFSEIRSMSALPQDQPVFPNPAHPACEVLRRAAVIRTDPTLATERCCQFTGSGIGTARAGETHPRRIANKELYGSDSTRHRCAVQAVRGSSGAPFVPMMQPTHLRNRDDPPGFWCLDRA